jgi:hypothetical protein
MNNWHFTNRMKRVLHALRIFCIKGEERWIALGSFIVFAALNFLQIYTNWHLYSKASHVGFYTIYYKNVALSGYDSWSCVYLSNGAVYFDTVRHPLYLAMLYPLSLLNQWVMHTFHISLAMPFMAVLLVFCVVWSAVFFYRLLRQVMELRRQEATILTSMLFSFAHVMIPAICPDHFIFSMFLLIMGLLIMGQCLKNGTLLSAAKTGTLLFFTAGMAPTNGLKTILGAWYIRGRRLFQWRYLVIGIIIPVFLISGVYAVTYYSIEKPAKEQVAKRDKKREDALRKQHNVKFFKAREEHNRWKEKNQGKTLGKGDVSQYLDISLSRPKSMWYNFFGEGIQLHRSYLLHDMLIDRPTFVAYQSWVNNAIEILVILLFLTGVMMGFRHRLMQLLLLWFTVDVMLNIVLGFALAEVYIMTSGWAFIIPVALGYLLKGAKERWRSALTMTMACLSVFLFCYNATLLCGYLIDRLN